jgi:BRCA1/BRCA2-containing complex subunit 3
VIAFQSLGGPQPALGAIVPVISNPIIDLESSWSSSDNSLTARYALDGMEQDTGDSRASNGSKVYFFILFVVVLLNLFP